MPRGLGLSGNRRGPLRRSARAGRGGPGRAADPLADQESRRPWPRDRAAQPVPKWPISQANDPISQSCVSRLDYETPRWEGTANSGAGLTYPPEVARGLRPRPKPAGRPAGVTVRRGARTPGKDPRRRTRARADPVAVARPHSSAAPSRRRRRAAAAQLPGRRADAPRADAQERRDLHHPSARRRPDPGRTRHGHDDARRRPCCTTPSRTPATRCRSCGRTSAPRSRCLSTGSRSSNRVFYGDAAEVETIRKMLVAAGADVRVLSSSSPTGCTTCARSRPVRSPPASASLAPPRRY